MQEALPLLHVVTVPQRETARAARGSYGLGPPGLRHRRVDDTTQLC